MTALTAGLAVIFGFRHSSTRKWPIATRTQPAGSRRETRRACDSVDTNVCAGVVICAPTSLAARTSVKDGLSA